MGTTVADRLLEYVPPRVVLPEAELARAAEVLNAGERVAMLVGGSTRRGRRGRGGRQRPGRGRGQGPTRQGRGGRRRAVRHGRDRPARHPAQLGPDDGLPRRVLWELSPRLPDGAIVTADSGSAPNWYARDVMLRPGMRASLSGTLAPMGCAVPYALAAKFRLPRPGGRGPGRRRCHADERHQRAAHRRQVLATM
jgi:thiamine pyrophosphate-dependent acetolactate synthase large subunit-like protein